MAAKKKGKDPFREIQNCLQKRDYKGALGWFHALLEQEKQNTQIRLRYADTLVLAGSKNEAIKQYRIVADEMAESGFMIRAIAINKKIVQLDPTQTDVHQKLGAVNEARSKGLSAAMAQLSSVITSYPGLATPPLSPSPARVAASPSQAPREEKPPPAPTMSLEDSLAMEFGDSTASNAAEMGEDVEIVLDEQPSASGEEEDLLEPVEEDLEASVTSPPGLESDEGGFEIVSEGEDVEVEVAGGAGAELEFESAGDEPSFSEDVVELESEERATEYVLETSDQSASLDQGSEVEDEGPVEFEIEVEPETAADGKAPLVGVLGEDIDALIDSIIDDLGSSVSGSSTLPARPADSPGGIPLFSQLSMQEFIDVAVVLDRRSMKTGTVIVREGEPGDSLFIVSTGEVDATREENGGTLKVATFRDGDFFGEMAVLSGEPRTATVTAVKNTELLELSRENLQRIFSKHPEVEAKIRLAYDERAMNDRK